MEAGPLCAIMYQMARSPRRYRRAIWCASFAFVFLHQIYAQTPAEAVRQADIKLAAHDLNGAWDLLHSALERNPEAPELSSSMGLIDYLRGEIANAEMEFKRAIRLNDKFARAWLGLGEVARVRRLLAVLGCRPPDPSSDPRE